MPIAPFEAPKQETLLIVSFEITISAGSVIVYEFVKGQLPYKMGQYPISLYQQYYQKNSFASSGHPKGQSYLLQFHQP